MYPFPRQRAQPHCAALYTSASNEKLRKQEMYGSRTLEIKANIPIMKIIQLQIKKMETTETSFILLLQALKHTIYASFLIFSKEPIKFMVS